MAAALGDANELAPFFRIPGLGRSDVVEHELAARSRIVFSTEVLADDWFRHITPAQIIERAIRRLQKRGSGILLLHDIHPATVLALPGLLNALKDRGFHIVHVVPAATAPQIVGGPQAWMASALPGQDIDVGAAVTAWPRPDVNLTSDDNVLPAPDEAVLDVDYPLGLATSIAGGTEGGIAWPNPSETFPPVSKPELRVPGVPDLGGKSCSARSLGRGRAWKSQPRSCMAGSVTIGFVGGRDRRPPAANTLTCFPVRGCCRAADLPALTSADASLVSGNGAVETFGRRFVARFVASKVRRWARVWW